MPDVNWQKFNLLVTQFFTKTLRHAYYCESCQQSTLSLQPLCNHCLNIIPRFSMSKTEGDLLNRPEIFKLFPKCKFDHLICISPYQPPINHWITKVKYQRNLSYQKVLNTLINKQLSELACIDGFKPPEVIIPVPLHIKKWQQRGFNQCDSIALTISRFFSVPVIANAVIRRKHASAQVSKNGVERRRSLKNSFTINDNFHYKNKRVWLIDDVITTGATANEISRQLVTADVENITLFTLAISL